MYSILLATHSWMRWILLVALLVAIGVGIYGTIYRRPFTAPANALRHWTATLAHLQLVLGLLLYFKSPLVQSFWSDGQEGGGVTFFGWIHALLMLSAVVVLTIGSAKAKRQPTDAQQYQTMWCWFLVGLLLIFIAIPWPFSPLASRPLWRPF